jgi:ABC-type uncharacterized transport system substrate-binding protein
MRMMGGRSYSWRLKAAASVAWLVALCALPPAFAGETVIVASSEAKPYAVAGTAAQERLERTGHKCSSLLLRDLTDARLREVMARKPEAFVAIGSEAAAALQQRLDRSVPLAYCMVADPESAGLTRGRPNQGVTTEVPLRAQLGLIAEALPKGGVIGMLYHGRTEKGQQFLKAVQGALPSGWRLEAVSVDDHAATPKAVDALLERKLDIIWTIPDASIYDAAVVRFMLLAALRRGVPVYGFSKPFVRAGALLGTGIEPQTQGEQSAELLLRQLKDSASDPAALQKTSAEAPRFEVIVNLVVADKLSLRVPDALTERASEVYREGKD